MITQVRKTQSTPKIFQLKGSMITVMVMELLHADFTDLIAQLEEKSRLAPDFFQDTPVVIALEKLASDAVIDFKCLLDQCRNAGLFPFAVKGGQAKQIEAARTAGLIAITNNKGDRPDRRVNKDESLVMDKGTHEAESSKVPVSQMKTAAIEQAAPVYRRTRVITDPIRSGQQIYARDGDLIILSSVSEGAEVLADGNIHVYGILRGRALAGVQGDECAKIFCSKFNASLVSIAGVYLLNENFEKNLIGKSVQISLRGEQLEINEL